MKHFQLSASIVIVLALALVTSACGAVGGASTTPVPTYAASRLNTSFSGALPSHLILAMGTLNLDATAHAVTPEQAKQLLPLWQALRSAVNSGGGNQAELDALLVQIDAVLTTEQIAAINALKLTSNSMRAWVMKQGLAPADPQMQATQEAMAKSSTLPGKGPVALMDAIVTYLEARQG
jgi:hypothetical protein